jgi:hypothetical protein
MKSTIKKVDKQQEKVRATFVLNSMTSVISRRYEIEICDEMMITAHICLPDVCQSIDIEKTTRTSIAFITLDYMLFIFCMISNNSIFIYFL